MTRWNLSPSLASEYTQTNPQVEKTAVEVSVPRAEFFAPIVSPPANNPISPVPIVADPLPPITVTKSPAPTENRQRYWESKFDVYLRLCRAAGILAFVPPGSDEYAVAFKNLITISTGEFQLIASPEVSSALNTFVEQLQTGNSDQIGKLKSAAQKLALACRQDTGAGK